MALIATAIERDGVARVFFDLRPSENTREQEMRIAAVIERACALILPQAEADQLRRAA